MRLTGLRDTNNKILSYLDMKDIENLIHTDEDSKILVMNSLFEIIQNEPDVNNIYTFSFNILKSNDFDVLSEVIKTDDEHFGYNIYENLVRKLLTLFKEKLYKSDNTDDIFSMLAYLLDKDFTYIEAFLNVIKDDIIIYNTQHLLSLLKELTEIAIEYNKDVMIIINYIIDKIKDDVKYFEESLQDYADEEIRRMDYYRGER